MNPFYGLARRHWRHGPVPPYIAATLRKILDNHMQRDIAEFMPCNFSEQSSRKTKGVQRPLTTFLGPWKSMAQVEWETLQRVSWYNNERLYGAIRHRLPQDVEDIFHERMNAHENAA